MKRTVCIILVCLMVFNAFSHVYAEGLIDLLFGWALEDLEEFEFELNPDETSYTLKEYNYLSKQATNQATIPQIYNDLPVTKIGSRAFYACKQIESVIIPEGIKEISAQAFYHCDNLESVVFPESLRSIGEYAFEGCDALTSLYFPEGVDIGFRAFCDCSNLKSVIIDVDDADSFKRYAPIDDYAFYECKKLECVTLGKDVTRIGSRAFCHCENLTTVSLTNSVYKFGDSAFEYCRNLNRFVFDGTSQEWSDIDKWPWWFKDAGDLNVDYLK